VFGEQYESPSDHWPAFDADQWFGGGFSAKGKEVDEQWPPHPQSQVGRWLKKHELEHSVAVRYGTSVMINTNMLMLPGSGGVLVAKGPNGQPLMWTFWFPHRRAVFDVFKTGTQGLGPVVVRKEGRPLPDDAEMLARKKFCEENVIAYGICEPGWRVTEDDITKWLDKVSPPR